MFKLFIFFPILFFPLFTPRCLSQEQVQYVANGAPTAEQFRKDWNELAGQLRKQEALSFPGLHQIFPGKAFSPYPFLIGQSSLEELHQLQKALYRTIGKIVESYPGNPELQDFYDLPAPMRKLFSGEGKNYRTYKLGSYRPDLLIDKNGNWAVCEINARFGSNGYFLSSGSSCALEHLSFLDHDQVKPISALATIPAYFKNQFPPTGTIGILKKREKGWDIQILKKILGEKGKRKVRFVDVDQLHIDEHGSLADKSGPLDHIILELHQDEILDLNPSVHQKIMETAHCLNDLRSIFLVHDKRLLSLLSTEQKIIDKLASESDLAILKKHIIPTHVIGKSDSKFLEVVLKTKDKWLIKANLLGKGDGIYLGKDMGPEEWGQKLSDPDFRDFVLQPLVSQPLIPIIGGPKLNGSSPHPTPMNAVGFMLCHDDTFFGPGVFRVSGKDIVNSGDFVIPCLKN